MSVSISAAVGFLLAAAKQRRRQPDQHEIRQPAVLNMPTCRPATIGVQQASFGRELTNGAARDMTAGRCKPELRLFLLVSDRIAPIAVVEPRYRLVSRRGLDPSSVTGS
jgi:hypothetical protein